KVAKSVIKEYLEDIPNEFEKLKAAIAENQPLIASQIAHTIKGAP
ncbi:MAG: Hpt domain-containing protein, partial [Candidatus Riflebacteria bacterium]|nr:Hpt domain-containing protein [Candidatus Riflebacteria bacterium]